MQQRLTWVVLTIVLAVVLGSFSTFQHVIALGFPYLATTQLERHNAVLHGTAGSPWQYRVLSEQVVEQWRLLLARRMPQADAALWAFSTFRSLLDTLIVLLALLYYRRLGIAAPLAFVGVAMLTWGMSYAHFNSDLQFNTFLDVSFFLAGGLLVLHKKYLWLIPLTALAAFNRETSGLIPLLALSGLFFEVEPGQRREIVTATGLSLLAYTAVFVWLRVRYGVQETITADGILPGLGLLRFNVARWITWEELIAVLSFVPVLALVGYKTWPEPLKGFAWAVVPLWALVHLLAAVLAEARLTLVPQALVFIPGALLFAQHHIRATAPAMARRR